MLLSFEIHNEGAFIFILVGAEFLYATRQATESRPESLEHAQTGMGDAQELGRTCYLRLGKWEGTPFNKVQVV